MSERSETRIATGCLEKLLGIAVRFSASQNHWNLNRKTITWPEIQSINEV